jgi:hypothetical protein
VTAQRRRSLSAAFNFFGPVLTAIGAGLLFRFGLPFQPGLAGQPITTEGFPGGAEQLATWDRLGWLGVCLVIVGTVLPAVQPGIIVLPAIWTWLRTAWWEERLRKGALIVGALGACIAVFRVLSDDWSTLSWQRPGVAVGLALGAAVGGGVVAALIGLGIGWLYQRGQPREEPIPAQIGASLGGGANWRRGLLRAWIALSITWMLASGFIWWSAFRDAPADSSAWIVGIVMVLAPPVAMLALGLTVWWIVAGFRRS